MLSVTRHKEPKAERKTKGGPPWPRLARVDALLPWRASVSQRGVIADAIRKALGDRLNGAEVLVAELADGDGGAKRPVGVGLFYDPHGNGDLAHWHGPLPDLQAAEGWRGDLGRALTATLEPHRGIEGEPAQIGPANVQRVILRLFIPEGKREAAKVDLAIAVARIGIPGELPAGSEGLLRFAVGQRSPFRASEAARDLGMKPEDCYAALRELEGAGYLTRVAEVTSGDPELAEALQTAAGSVRGRRERKGLRMALGRASRPVADALSGDRFAANRVAAVVPQVRLNDADPPEPATLEVSLRGDYRSASALLGEACSEWTGILQQIALAAREIARTYGSSATLGARR